MIPSFPHYTGPYQVGSIDIEIPVSELESPVSIPSDASDIHTVLVRVFYPATPESHDRNVDWLPSPQRQSLSAYARFVGLGPAAASIVSYIPRHTHYTKIPAHKNAATFASPLASDGRWPTAIFSHGLAGCRNSYSSIAGSLASHGVIVFCPEHRDGSAILTMVRNPSARARRFPNWWGTAEMRLYLDIGHEVTAETFKARDRQLRIRLWELGLVHSLIIAIDRGQKLGNLKTSARSLGQFADKMDVHRPGKMVFMGHSFGAASVVQFIKSVYYANSPALKGLADPLFVPHRDSNLCAQITHENVVILLDMWCLPLFDPSTTALLELPLPAYDNVRGAPGGRAILAVDSEQFVKWSEHFHATARIVSKRPGQRVVSQEDFVNQATGAKMDPARFFWVHGSAHMNQSDFCVLFPWLTKKIFKAGHPEQVLRLNLRAQLQVLRENGVVVAETSAKDRVDDGREDANNCSSSHGSARASADGEPELGHENSCVRLSYDNTIFNMPDTIKAWGRVDIFEMGAESANFGWKTDSANPMSNSDSDQSTSATASTNGGQGNLEISQETLAQQISV
ncbi:hypothetical protein Cpir12675_004300 [Ceratocystis pirilliformis]|uniref:Putative phospholipase n=1 Tax=Ceratocystis pirilliformis TaxID=259994 RepID=A0ABR3YYU0_9PEZI